MNDTASTDPLEVWIDFPESPQRAGLSSTLGGVIPEQWRGTLRNLAVGALIGAVAGCAWALTVKPRRGLSQESFEQLVDYLRRDIERIKEEERHLRSLFDEPLVIEPVPPIPGALKGGS